MLQQRKKDYLQRLIEEFFKKLEVFINGSNDNNLSETEKKSILADCFQFFSENFAVNKTDDVSQLAEKIDDINLLEQYAKILTIEYDITENKDRSELEKALAITQYLEKTDSTYSWDRTVLREDILRRLDESI